MYPQRFIQPYYYGFPVMPAPRPTGTAYSRPQGSVSTTEGGQVAQPSALQQYGPNVASAALRKAMAPAQSNIQWNGPRVNTVQYADYNNPGMKMGGDDYNLTGGGADQGPAITPNDEPPYGATNSTQGIATGTQDATGTTQGGLLSDTSTPEAVTAGDTGVSTGTAGTAAGTGTGTAAGTTAADAGTAAAGTDATAGTAAAAGTDAAATDAGLLAATDTAAADAAAADAGLLGTGAAAGGEAAAGAAAGEGTAAAVGATNFWNPLGWAALAGLAAYQLGLFD